MPGDDIVVAKAEPLVVVALLDSVDLAAEAPALVGGLP